MALRHRELPIEGVQFHPESVLTEGGHQMLATWLAVCGLAPDPAPSRPPPRARAGSSAPPDRAGSAALPVLEGRAGRRVAAAGCVAAGPVGVGAPPSVRRCRRRPRRRSSGCARLEVGWADRRGRRSAG